MENHNSVTAMKSNSSRSKAKTLKARFSAKELTEMQIEINQLLEPNSIMQFKSIHNITTNQQMRDVIMYHMMRDILFSLNSLTSQNKESMKDTFILAHTREGLFKSTFIE